MAEHIKKHWDLALITSVGLVLLAGALFSAFPNPVSSQTSSSVIVTAYVREYITIAASAGAVTLTPDLVDTSGTARIGTSSITLTLNTSSGDGYSISVGYDTNTGLNYGATSSIQTYSATATITAGTDGFGIQATSSDMTIYSRYNWSTSTTIIGSASSTANATSFATKATAGSDQIAYVRFLAAATSSKPAGTYTGTVTFTATASP